MSLALSPAQLFKCLAEDTRLRMLLLIVQEQELCVCELTCALGQSQPKISRHLAQLRTSGVLADRRQGQWVYYRLHAELPTWVTTVLHTTLQANQDWLYFDQKRLQLMGADRPVRAAACCAESSVEG